MICPNCGSNNINVQAVQQTQLAVKHHGIIWWLLIGWYWIPIKWLFFTVPALIVKIFAPKKHILKQTTKSVCVCQNCGYHWEVGEETDNWEMPEETDTPQIEDTKTLYIEPAKNDKPEDGFHNFQKSADGLYAYEILMLFYLEKYTSGKTIAKFWEQKYGVDDVPALIQSLEQRGFAKNGKLTETGKSVIAKNEYVLYMHRHKYYDIPLSRMSILVNKNPDMNYRDLLWGEFNRLSVEYMQHSQFGLYRCTRFSMYLFLLEEKRYAEAFPRLAETFFYDLNGDEYPCIAPATIKEIRNIEQKIDYTDEKMKNELQKLFAGMYVPYQNYTNDEVICIIIAYCFGNDEIAEKIFQRHAR